MSDFVDGFWNLYIAGITIVSIIGCAVLLTMQHQKRVPGQAVGTTGHEWDEAHQAYLFNQAHLGSIGFFQIPRCVLYHSQHRRYPILDLRVRIERPHQLFVVR